MAKPTATKYPVPTATEVAFFVEALRKLALQRDTKAKYAEDEDEAEGFHEDISFIRETLAKYGDTKPLVLKSERKPKAKKDAKAKATAKPKAKAVATK